MTTMLFGYAALGLVITLILAACIPPGKAKKPEDEEAITDYGDGTCGFKVKDESGYWFGRAKHKALSGKPLVYLGIPISVTSVQFSDFGEHCATVVYGRRVDVVDTPIKVASDEEINKAKRRMRGGSGL